MARSHNSDQRGQVWAGRDGLGVGGWRMRYEVYGMRGHRDLLQSTGNSTQYPVKFCGRRTCKRTDACPRAPEPLRCAAEMTRRCKPARFQSNLKKWGLKGNSSRCFLHGWWRARSWDAQEAAE